MCKKILKAGKYSLNLDSKTHIMAILNITPDSFSNDGCLIIDKAVEKAKQFIDQGADIIDIGGESSRPGASPVDLEEERNRVIPVIKALAKEIDIPISIDTYKTQIAKEALESGAVIVNNIKGINLDADLLQVVKDFSAALVLMHMRNNPETMQENIEYDDVIADISALLNNSVKQCLDYGISKENIAIDPGIGFGKTVEQNCLILNKLKDFCNMEVPVLIGTSRKSFIGHILNCEVNNRLNGTIASCCIAAANGASIVRVHDVKEIKEALTVVDAIK